MSKDEVDLIEDLAINKADAELYTSLKEDRHNASYSTSTLFTREKVLFYEEKVLEFMQKTEDMLTQS